MARRRPLAFEITVLPEWKVRPAVGLSFLYSEDSVFDTFGTRTLEDMTQEVIVSGSEDRRFSYGLTLGLTYKGIDFRDREGGKLALWLPELHVNPSTTERSVGFGIAASWKLLKIGIGRTWTRHTVLDGIAIGDPLPAGETVPKTRDSFGSGEFYVSISIVGWEPFVN